MKVIKLCLYLMIYCLKYMLGCTTVDIPPLYHAKNFRQLSECLCEGRTPTMVGYKANSAAACQFSSDSCWAGSPILIDLFLFLKHEGYCFFCCCLPPPPSHLAAITESSCSNSSHFKSCLFFTEAADVPITLH